MPRDRVLFEFELHWHCHHKNVQSDSILKGKNVNEYDRWKVNVFDRIRTFLNFVYISILYLLVGIGVRSTRWNRVDKDRELSLCQLPFIGLH